MTHIAEQQQDARAIANYILDKAPKYDIDDLSPMKLLKLIFLAHGWSFYLCEQPLLNEQPQAWPYGPVYPAVYNPLRKYGGNPVRERIINAKDDFPFAADLTKEQKAAVDAVLSKYGKMSAFRLSSITHLPGSPWSETKEKSGLYSSIPADLMKDYYIGMAKKAGLPE